jgi:hypothetical protein
MSHHEDDSGCSESVTAFALIGVLIAVSLHFH